MNDLPVRLNSWIENLKPQETVTPVGGNYFDRLIAQKKELIRKERAELEKLGGEFKDGSDIHLLEIMMLQMDHVSKNLAKLQNGLKNLENQKQSQDSLLAEMTLLFEKMLDKKKGSEYGDDFEEHF